MLNPVVALSILFCKTLIQLICLFTSGQKNIRQICMFLCIFHTSCWIQWWCYPCFLNPYSTDLHLAKNIRQRAIVLFNRNLPTCCHETSLRAFESPRHVWATPEFLYCWLTCRVLCAYSIGAGQIHREKHYCSLYVFMHLLMFIRIAEVFCMVYLHTMCDTRCHYRCLSRSPCFYVCLYFILEPGSTLSFQKKRNIESCVSFLGRV